MAYTLQVACKYQGTKGQSVSYAYANTHIPSYSYAAYDTGQDTWINWAGNNNIKTYYFDGTSAINNALNSGVLEKGDIIFYARYG